MLSPPRYLQQDLIYSYLQYITIGAVSIKKKQVYKNIIQIL